MELTHAAEEYETHITVCLDNAAGMPLLQEWATQHDWKCVHILLDRGVTASQPMLTKHGQGHVAAELKAAFATSDALIRAGFPVTRVKIEAAPWNQDVPQTTEEAATNPPGRYFEHHIKLLLEPTADMAVLASVARQYGGHLSRNALKQREDGYQERFVTQRCSSVGRNEAHRQCIILQHELARLGHPILETEEEFVVFDSNLDLDAGWIKQVEPVEPMKPMASAF